MYALATTFICMARQPARLLQALAKGAEACVAVTLVDGMVLARSAMHHSMNYRSVVLFGTANVVEDEAEKLAVLQALTDHLIPGTLGRCSDSHRARIATDLSYLPYRFARHRPRFRSGPPLDDEPDYDLPYWAGVIPLRLAASDPVPDSRLGPGIETASLCY